MSSPGPLVSMIMPVWNPHLDWLRLAVRSALDQRGCRIELIVVDDGCPEPVADLLADVDDERLRVLRVAHGGECLARNAGIAAAGGDWVRFIDADDVQTADGTATLLGLATGDDVIAYGATLFCDQELRPRWKMVSRLRGRIARECLVGRFAVRPFALIFPRRVVEATGEWDPAFQVSQDWDYVLRALEHAEVRGTDELVTLYRKHAGAATADLAAGEAGGRRVVSRYFERHPEERGTALERRAYARVEAISARASLTRGQVGQTLTHLRRAARDPRAIADEIVQALPALAGTVRSRVAVRSRPAA